MSDDLERAADGIWNVWGENNTREYARAALLSFLDMDEAGVERLARVIRNSDLVNTLDESGGVPSWNHSVGAARWMTRECLECARTVLTELRKMASPTQRDEGE